jgi:hypothetical protein
MPAPLPLDQGSEQALTSKAHVESDFGMDGVKIAIRNDHPEARLVRLWPLNLGSRDLLVRSGEQYNPPEGFDQWLRLSDEEARALYQAIGEYYGAQVSDSRLLRADYEAERRRVDQFIRYFVEPVGATSANWPARRDQ